MQIFIFTYDRYATLTTPAYFEKENIPHTILCHSEDDKLRFQGGGKINPRRIIATGQPKGLANNRNFALDLMEDGEWALFFVDDLRVVYEYALYDTEKTEKLPVTILNTKAYAKLFKKMIPASRFLERCHEAIAKAEDEDVDLVGFAGFTNPLFLARKWKHNALADGRCWLVRKSNLRFDTETQMVDDISWSVLNIRNKGLLINQWIIPECQRYTAGGYGSKAKRMEQRIKECKYLAAKYPGNIRFAKKAGWPPFSHIRIRHKKYASSV